MADTNNVAPEMKKSLSLFNFFTIGFGAIIGTGWVLLVGDWMILGGGPYPAMIAFAIGALFLVPIGLVFGELTAANPISASSRQRPFVPVGSNCNFNASYRSLWRVSRSCVVALCEAVYHLGRRRVSVANSYRFGFRRARDFS